MRGGITNEQVDARMNLIQGAMELVLGDVDLVIEAVFERMDIKKQIPHGAGPDLQTRRDPGHQHLY